MTYFLVTRAYRRRDANSAKAYLAPETFTSWSAQVAELIASHRRPVFEDLNVRGIRIEQALHEANGDTLIVHLDLVAADRFVDDRDGRLIAGSKENRPFGARWTFGRAAGASTRVDGGVVASKCPKCGAPLRLEAAGTCAYCRAEVATGAFDWTVRAMESVPFIGIDRYAAVDTRRLDPSTGFAQIRADDAKFSEETLLARIRASFALLQDAWQQRDLEAARPSMSPGLYLAWSTQVEQLIEDHKKNVLEGLRVDGVTALWVVHGRTFDDVAVRVDATCADYEIDETTNRVIFGDRTPRPFHEFWTFQRAVGTQSVALGIADKHCPNCGAPVEITQIGECTYCRAAVTSGRFDWVLSRIEQEETYVDG